MEALSKPVYSWECLAYRYALLRVLIGTLAIFTFLTLQPLLNLHFSNQGWYTSRTVGIGATGVYLDAPPAVWVHGLFWLCQMSLLYFVLGLLPQIAGAVAFTGMSALYLRNPLPFDADDEVIRSTLFLLLFAPTAARLSVESCLGLPQRSMAKWPLRLIRFKIAFLYGASGVEKLLGDSWHSGTALSVALHNPAYARFEVPSSIEPLLGFISISVPYFELALCVLLLWARTRIFGVVLGLSFHALLGVFMDLRWFTLIMVAHYVAFVSDSWLLAGARTLRVIRTRLYALCG